MALVTTQLDGYLDGDYDVDPYLSGTLAGNMGLQFLSVPSTTHAEGLQAQGNIASLKALGLQTQANILSTKALGLQARGIISTTDPLGLQAQGNILATKPLGLQFRGTVSKTKALGLQFRSVDFGAKPLGLQAQGNVYSTKAKGLQFRADKGLTTLICGEAGGYLEDDYLEDAYLIPGRCGHMGLQFQSVRVNGYGLQFLSVLYNVTNLRVLCNFPSRGDGTNWSTNSQAPGDFDVNNVNTDIEEEVWRSNGDVSGVHLDCDTGVPQGVFLDTLALRNHNFTTSADVHLIGSNTADFSVVGTDITLQEAANNLYYVAKDFPVTGYRYWKISIDDPTNTSGFLQVGVIVFGTAVIFQGENFVDQIEYQPKDFADGVRTMAFTNVFNSRALKNILALDFRSLSSELSNFKKLRDLFVTYRTTYKCLWIPTPDPDDQEYTGRFAVFGKITAIPRETHNNKGKKSNFVTLAVEVDESL